MDFNTNKILITGAGGWLGRTLVHSLLNGINGTKDLEKPNKAIDIKCLVKPGENINFLELQSNNVSIVYGDITNMNDCKLFMNNSKNAILFHCAGIIHPTRTKYFYDINVNGTKNILDVASDMKIKKIIAVSSNSPCGTNPSNNHLFDEQYNYNPYLGYGKSKMEMEKLINKYYSAGKVETVIIRPPWFYGPFQPPRQTKFYKMIRDGKVPVIGDGENKRSMACTINIVQGLIRSAIEHIAIGKIYWISDEKPYSFNEIIKITRDVMSKEFSIKCKDGQINLPNLISSTAYQLDKFIQSIGFYNKEIHVLSEMNKTIACSIKKAQNEINYYPTVSLYEGTTMSIKSILKEF